MTEHENTQKHAGGRPLLFPTVEALENAIALYFQDCRDETGKKWVRPPTISGLAVALETSRETLKNYKERPEYFDSIKKAKDIIAAYNEEQLYRPTQVAGVIFNLKNNFDWEDKQNLDHTTKGKELSGEIIRDKARSILENESETA